MTKKPENQNCEVRLPECNQSLPFIQVETEDENGIKSNTSVCSDCWRTLWIQMIESGEIKFRRKE